jgi:hypothetical protein
VADLITSPSVTFASIAFGTPLGLQFDLSPQFPSSSFFQEYCPDAKGTDARSEPKRISKKPEHRSDDIFIGASVFLF